MNKSKNNISFIESLATTTLNDTKSTINKSNDSNPITKSIEEDNKININTPKPIPHGNKSSMFIQDLMNNHYKTYDKVKEKSPTHIDKSTHYKIKLISTVTQIGMIELVNAILVDYLNNHKGEIDNLLKKANF